jgi:hypothetical protein
MNRSERIRFLTRRNQGRIALPGILARLSAAWLRPVAAAEVGPLEERDRLYETVLPSIQAAYEARRPPAFSAWPRSAGEELARGLASLGGELAGEPVYFFSLYWDCLGLIRIDPRVHFARAVATAEGISEDWVACTRDGGAGLFLAYHSSDASHGFPCPYELIVWGSSWQARVQGHLPLSLACQRPY